MTELVKSLFEVKARLEALKEKQERGKVAFVVESLLALRKANPEHASKIDRILGDVYVVGRNLEASRHGMATAAISGALLAVIETITALSSEA